MNKIFILITLIIFSGVSYLGFSKYYEYKTESFLRDERIQAALLDHQKDIIRFKKEVGLFKLESEEKVGEIKRKLEAEEAIRKAIESDRGVQDKLSQQKIDSLEEQIFLASTLPSTPSIIESWKPIVSYVECNFQLSNSGIYYNTSGSGVVVKFDDLPIKVLTNRHVLTGPAFYDLSSCDIKFSNNNSKLSVPVSDISISNSGYDWGALDINNPDENVNNLTSIFPKLCDQKPDLGDQVVVLGYPGIGSKEGITATEGIISGFDGNYFITSAKVEQGNSGGAAILQKESCLLGIPTFASLGQVESLARILDIWTIVIKK